jgi:hypothetical protein
MTLEETVALVAVARGVKSLLLAKRRKAPGELHCYLPSSVHGRKRQSKWTMQ